MRFVVGSIPDSRTLDAEETGWTPLNETSAERFAGMAAMLSLPFLAAALMVLFDTRLGMLDSQLMQCLYLASEKRPRRRRHIQ
jgi:high-affinity nickel permease